MRKSASSCMLMHETDETGEGYVAQRGGDYVDARQRGKQTIPLIAEVFGGLIPSTLRPLPPAALARGRLAHLARQHQVRPPCPELLREHHGQRISHAIVMTDALTCALNMHLRRHQASPSSRSVRTLTQ